MNELHWLKCPSSGLPYSAHMACDLGFHGPCGFLKNSYILIKEVVDFYECDILFPVQRLVDSVIYDLVLYRVIRLPPSSRLCHPSSWYSHRQHSLCCQQ